MEETEPRQTDAQEQRKPAWQYHPSLNRSKQSLSPLFFALYITDEAVPYPSLLLSQYLTDSVGFNICWILNITTGPLLDIYLQGYLFFLNLFIIYKERDRLKLTQNVPIKVCPC